MRQRLDTYDELPREMRRYLAHHGWHFSKKACDFAVSMMRRRNSSTGAKERIAARTREDVDALLNAYRVVLENNTGYDYVYVANMVVANFWESSITEEKKMAAYIKDVVDDVDQADGFIFNRWLADMCINGVPIEWEDLL